MVEKIRLSADDDAEPYALLEPLVNALLQRGNTLAREGEPGSPFGPSPEGYIAVLSEPIDWDFVTRHFEFPSSVRYVADRDIVYDDVHWTAVYGSGGRRAFPPSLLPSS